MSAAAVPRASGDPAAGCEDDERLGRAHLSRVVEPGDPALEHLLGRLGWQGLLRLVRDGGGPEVWAVRHQRLRTPTTAFVDSLARRGVAVVHPASSTWPEGLHDLDGTTTPGPVCLWVRGRLPVAPHPPAVALVGARACTAYGEHVAQDIAAGLVQRGWTVVSGAAYGIDAAAHSGALGAAATTRAGGAPPVLPTVAVLAGGVDRASPSGHEGLLQRVVDLGGAVVSEVPPGTRPAPYRFLLRNRLIAAWARATVVVEAGHRSGALSTARTAAELHRDVAAVPGPVTSGLSAGCHGLLRLGAPCVTSAEDVVGLVEPFTQESLDVDVTSGPGADGGRQRREDDARVPTERVLQALRRSAWRGLDDVVAATGLPHHDAAAALARLVLEGAAERGPSGWRRGARVRGGDAVVP